MKEPSFITIITLIHMKKPIIYLLAFNATTAILGGIALIVGWNGGISESVLRYTFFGDNLLWPGIILTFIVGGSALAALLLFIKNHEYAPLVALLSGFIMDTWILAEMLLIVDFSWLQVLYLMTGIAVIILSAEYIISHLEQNTPGRKNHKEQSRAASHQ
jgi:hypothetical protein